MGDITINSNNNKEVVPMPTIEPIIRDQIENQEKPNESITKPQDTMGRAVVKKHLVTFVGNGIWIDAHGVAWSRTHKDNSDMVEQHEFGDDEYNERSDIHFMVEYGAMKHTEISL